MHHWCACFILECMWTLEQIFARQKFLTWVSLDKIDLLYGILLMWLGYHIPWLHEDSPKVNGGIEMVLQHRLQQVLSQFRQSSEQQEQ